MRADRKQGYYWVIRECGESPEVAWWAGDRWDLADGGLPHVYRVGPRMELEPGSWEPDE